MKFIPNSALKEEMLKDIGLKHIDELFSDIPKKIRIKGLDLPKGLSQQETEKKLREIAGKNKSFCELLSFLGGGIKPHYIPAVVKSMISRAEFYTSYTPYQSEASQGFLQAMFEYQSVIAEITGMDIANASMYDGATALGEAALMCARVKKGRDVFVIPGNISWDKKSVLKNYTQGPNISVKEVSYDKKTGRVDVSKLVDMVDESVAGVYVENPNFFGVFEEDIEKISKIVRDAGSLFVVGVDPVSLGVVRAPGSYGADVVIGEGRALGNSMSFGGDSLGIFASKNEYLRQIPGRIIGMTKDEGGKRAFCMALQTREQHIRRGRATSNICTNEGLCALSAVVYMAWLGGTGLRELGRVNFENGQRLAKSVEKVDGFKRVFNGVHFNEFVVKSDVDVDEVNSGLLKQGIQGGFVLDEKCYPGLNNCMLFGNTEMHSDSDMEKLVNALREVS